MLHKEIRDRISVLVKTIKQNNGPLATFSQHCSREANEAGRQILNEYPLRHEMFYGDFAEPNKINKIRLKIKFF